MLKKLFGFEKGVHNVKVEILAGVTTFLTMAYILAVNPNILSETGMDKGALFTTTVVMAAFSTILMGFYAKLPFALAPGMGLNAFFALTICSRMGCSWEFALTAVLVEGLIFILLTVTNVREYIVYLLPEPLRHAISAGIGLYIAFIGLKSAEVIVDHESTLVALGEIASNMNSLLCLIGIVLTSVLLIKKIRGAFLIGILGTTLIGIPMGVTHIDGIFSLPPSVEPIFCKFTFDQIFTNKFFVVVFTLLFVDLFDTIGTIIGVTTRAGMMKDGKIPGLKRAFMVDAIGTTVGAAMGTSTVTTFVESAAGVNIGGKTGLTAVSAGVCFLVAIVFAPFFMAIPAAATAPVLVLVGLMMLSSVSKLDLNDCIDSIPAFLCMLIMPLSYSISDGIIVGHISYVLISLCCGRTDRLNLGMIVLALCFTVKFFLPEG